jgi:hypothetical protein
VPAIRGAPALQLSAVLGGHLAAVLGGYRDGRSITEPDVSDIWRVTSVGALGGLVAETWLNMLWSWLPLIALVGFWTWYGTKHGGFSQYSTNMSRQIELLERQQVLLERIAVALEARNKLSR